MIKKILIIIISTLFITLTVNSQTIKYEGKDYFINGANIPWNAFGNDVGYSYNALWFENIFSQAERSGMNCLRLWIHCDGRGTLNFTLTGAVSGIDTIFYSSFDDIFKRAKQHHIMIIPCLWSFDMTNANRADLIQDSIKTKSYVDNVLIPMVKRYANQCNLFAWEIINEPEWSMKVPSGGVTKQKVTANEMQRFVGMMAAAIHRNSSKMVTVGSAALKYNSTVTNCVANYWSDKAIKLATKDSLAFLDFYQIHYYDWMYPNFDPFDAQKPYSYWNLDKPVLIGENSGKDVRYNPNVMLENAYTNNFAGVMFWSIAAFDGISTINDFITASSDFRIKHFNNVSFSCDPNEVLSVDSAFFFSNNKFSLGVDSNNTKTMALSSNIPWKITNKIPWLEVLPDTANGSDTIIFRTLSTNNNTIERYDTVWIKSAGKSPEMISIMQQKPAFSVYPRTINLTEKTYSSSSFTITTNVAWSITGIDTSWLNIYPSSGFGNTKIKVISITSNDTNKSSRTVELTITNPYLPSATVTINQPVLSDIVSEKISHIILPNANKGVFSLLISDCWVEVLTLSGETVFKRYTKANEIIDLSRLSSGVYVLNATTPKGTIIEKMVIIK